VVWNEIRMTNATFDLTTTGLHTVHVWPLNSGVVLEKLALDFGGVAARGYSYLGPPESRRQ